MITSVLLMMQFVVSAKAGMVNYVDGAANVRRQQQVQVGTPITTQSGSHVEFLLSPGSYLRLGENSAVVFDSVQLSNIAFHVVSGNALVEAGTINKDFPIHVSSGELRVAIVAPGVYRFSAGSATVLNGKLRLNSGTTIKKGQQVNGLNGTEQIVKLEGNVPDDLDGWSSERAGDLAKANALAYRDRSATYYNSYADYPTYGLYSLNGAWLYSAFLGGFTFLPFDGYRSFYGYSFYPVASFGFQPFVPAANRPFSNPTANTASNQVMRPIGGPSHSPTQGQASNGAFHAPIHAGPTGGGGGGMSTGAAIRSGSINSGSGAVSGGGGGGARPAASAGGGAGRRP